MSVNVFNNPFTTTESFSAQGAVLNWVVGSKTSTLPLILTGIAVSYNRPTQSLYPINGISTAKPVRVLVHGAPTGQLQTTSIYSPSMSDMEAFIKAVTKDCKTKEEQVDITLRPFGSLSCAGNDKKKDTTKFTLTGVELSGFQLNIQGGEIALVTMPLTFTFAGLFWDFNSTEAPSKEKTQNTINSQL